MVSSIVEGKVNKTLIWKTAIYVIIFKFMQKKVFYVL